MGFAPVCGRPYTRKSPVVGRVEYAGPNRVRGKRQSEQEHQKHEAEPHQNKVCIVDHRSLPFPRPAARLGQATPEPCDDTFTLAIIREQRLHTGIGISPQPPSCFAYPQGSTVVRRSRADPWQIRRRERHRRNTQTAKRRHSAGNCVWRDLNPQPSVAKSPPPREASGTAETRMRILFSGQYSQSARPLMQEIPGELLKWLADLLHSVTHGIRQVHLKEMPSNYGL